MISEKDWLLAEARPTPKKKAPPPFDPDQYLISRAVDIARERVAAGTSLPAPMSPPKPKPERTGPIKRRHRIVPTTEREWAVWNEGYRAGLKRQERPVPAKVSDYLPQPPRRRGRPPKPKPPKPPRCQAVNTRGSQCKSPGVPVDGHLVCGWHQENPPKKGWW